MIHVNVWQKPLQYCKLISLQLIKITGKKRIFQILTFVLHQQEEICLCDCENTIGGTAWNVYRHRCVPGKLMPQREREMHAGAREQGEHKLMKTNDEGRGVCAEEGEEREKTWM